MISGGSGSPTKHVRLSHEDVQSLITIAKENGLHPYLNQKHNAIKVKKEIPKGSKEERIEQVKGEGKANN